MLRISVFEEPLSVKVRFEGTFDPTAQVQLAEALEKVAALGGKRRLLADVGDVNSEDAFTLSALSRMEEQGFELVTPQPTLSALLTRQASADCKQHCTWSQKLLYWIAGVECCIPRWIRTRACAIVRNATQHGRHGLPCKQ